MFSPLIVKLSALKGEAFRKGGFIHIVPPDPALKRGFAGHVPVRSSEFIVRRFDIDPPNSELITPNR
jgi:hypothetical protein